MAYKKLSEATLVESVAEEATMLIEENDEIKRVPVSKMGFSAGGGGGGATFIEFDENTNTVKIGDQLLTFDSCEDTQSGGVNTWEFTGNTKLKELNIFNDNYDFIIKKDYEMYDSKYTCFAKPLNVTVRENPHTHVFIMFIDNNGYNCKLNLLTE